VAKIVGDSIFSAFVEMRGRQRPQVSFDEDDDEIIRKPVPLHIPAFNWWGHYLNMAPNVSCVVVHPNGRSETHATGGLRPFIPGRYQLIYVDMREQSSLLSDVEAHSSDAWRVRLTVELSWQVRDAWRVARMTDPRAQLHERCTAAIVNYIQSQPYEKLIATPETSPLDEAQIMSEIMERFSKNRALTGFRFNQVSVLGRLGDPDRTQKIKDAMIKVEEARRDKDVAIARMESARAQQDLNLQIARANAEKEKELADYSRQIFELLYPAQEQLIQLEQLRQSQQLKQERIIKAWEITGNAMSQVATILGQLQATPGAQHQLDAQVVDTLMQIMKNLTGLMPPQAHVLNEPGEEQRVLPAVSINRNR